METLGFSQTEAERRDAQRIATLQMEAAKEAATVSSFTSAFRGKVRSALNEGEIQSEEMVEQRLEAVNAIKSDDKGMRLDTTRAGVLGYNRIGGGDESMRLSRHTFATIRSKDEAVDIHQTVAHESAHGQQVVLSGELVVDGQAVDHELLYEGHAELHGNEAVGKGISHHRDGQPQQTYREGQDIVARIISKTSRAALEKALTGDGDLSRLQQEIDGKPSPKTTTVLSA